METVEQTAQINDATMVETLIEIANKVDNLTLASNNK